MPQPPKEQVEAVDHRAAASQRLRHAQEASENGQLEVAAQFTAEAQVHVALAVEKRLGELVGLLAVGASGQVLARQMFENPPFGSDVENPECPGNRGLR
jgi:hypothetical protein